MKRLILPALLSMVLMLALTRNTYALSAGFERYKDDKTEIYLEYLPQIPFDPAYPTASEEFAFIYTVVQNSFWTNLITKYIPFGFQITVLVADLQDDENFATWKVWHPISTTELGMTIKWGLSIDITNHMTLSGNVEFSKIKYIDTDYNKHQVGEWSYLSSINIGYSSGWGWEYASTSGGGSMAIRNDLASSHEGHQCLVWVHVAHTGLRHSASAKTYVLAPWIFN